jgi:predicted PurR-regulated permease PerM
MISQTESLRARAIRRLWVNLIVGGIVAALAVYFFAAARELVLPTILGAFLGYLFRPLVGVLTGPPLVKLAKTGAMLLAIGCGIYFGTKGIKASLPNEKEQLELLVRLQYRLNLRYTLWMGLSEDPAKGNWVHGLVGKELDPLVKQVNHFLSLDPEQRKTFLLYRQGHNGMTPVKDKYFEYFLANLKEIQAAETVPLDQPTESDSGKNATVGPQPKAPSGLATMLRLFSVWLAFPLVFTFILKDKGQIQQFFLRLVPNRYFELSRTIMDEVDDALGRYIRGTVLECFLVGLTISVGLWLCGFAPNIYILVGLIGGVTNAIPFVGTALACAVGLVFALIAEAENVHPILPFITVDNLFIAVVGVVMVAHLLDNAIYQPVVVGGAVNIHPLAVILSVLGGSLVFGFAGLLLAIPTIVVLKVVTETLFHELKAYKII